jgi:formylglycine-generating enzyme required for sulfatase activity
LEIDLGGGVKMEFVLIPAGEFMMGSPVGEERRNSDEGPQHKVKITKSFYIGVLEVTQEQYQQIMDKNPSHFRGARNPVEKVSWNDAVEFCRKLSQKDGATYRLPTEAEWEYACRAGTTTPFYTGSTISTDQANYDGDYTYGNGRKGVDRKKTLAVGSFAPNAFGLYDMHGNVWEWCQSLYKSYPYRDADGRENLSSVGSRVLRGGSWGSKPRGCRSAHRRRSSPANTYFGSGFRIVVIPVQEFK